MPNINTTHDDIPELPDGLYDIDVPHTHRVRFMVHTVTSGQLAGQRIVKMPSANGFGGWKGFATLKVDSETRQYNTLQVWRSQVPHVTGEYAANVAVSIRSFIQRVRNETESTFIVINDCPELPDHVRARTTLHFSSRPPREDITDGEGNIVRTISEPTNVSRPSHFNDYSELRANRARAIAHEQELRDARRRRRTVALAMSEITPSEIR